MPGNQSFSMTRRIWLLLLVAMLLVPASRAAAEFRLFELQHRQASELIDTVRSALSDSARVSAYRNVLMVNAEAEEMRAVTELIAMFDKASAMLRITVEQGRSDVQQDRNIGGALRVEQGPVTVRAGRAPAPGVGVGRIASEDAAASLSINASERRNSQQTSQFIMVMDGEAARISVGRLIPFTSRLRLYCRRHAGCIERVERIEMQKVDTGFEVAPRSQGDRVELDIRPFMAFPEGGHGEHVVFHELATRVVVNYGEWLDLGGQLATHDDLGRAILEQGSESVVSQTSVRLRVDRQ